MDELDHALLDAWARIAPRIKADRLEARRRAMRRMGLSRPVRPWCLCIRASDSRITDYRAQFDDRVAWASGRAHTVRLDGEFLRVLCGPVRIPWPGVTIRAAAGALGRSEAL